ncbi:lysine-specific demethylase 4A-like [Aphidius gifuensis]|uniref:lysine-specific demethylase 4A-like n=1 Tax=Aphidius gifuensis TaxID=684658 RepID=UPI001CDD7EB3|nr:lysine-specific demethylase 4A-like [Aphidius gifuensis]
MINNTDGSFEYETNLYKKNEKFTYNQYHEECDKFIRENSSSEVSHDSDEYLAMLNTNPCFLYAPDIKFSIFERMYNNDPTQSSWNLSNFKSHLSRIKNEDNKTVEGIHTPFVYCGSKWSSFPIHLEDYTLISINYHFYGLPKIWLIRNNKDSTRFHQLINTILNKTFPGRSCMFVITHPYSFHGGYNLGPNINEAVNYATTQTIKYFANAIVCSCEGIVKLNGSKIIKEFYPSFKDELKGIPDDPKIIIKKKRRRNSKKEIYRIAKYLFPTF